MIDRREMIGAFPALLMAGGALAAGPSARPFEAALAAIEAKAGGRLGVALLREDGAVTGHRLEERFPMCSTFKALAVAAILRRVDAGTERLDRVVRFGKADLIPYSPVTGPQADGPGMTIAALCEATMTMSDNSAANLVLAALGGPPAVTAFARAIGDDVTRLDRREPDLNSGIPGDPRDTTSPAAMAADYRALATGPHLSPASRAQWVAWLVGNTVGGHRLRAALPSGWRIGDRTGTSDGIANDVAILWPPGGGMLIAAAYYTESQRDADGCDRVIADVGRAIVKAVRRGDA